MNATDNENDVSTGRKQIKPILDIKPVIAIPSAFFSLDYFCLLMFI